MMVEWVKKKLHKIFCKIYRLIFLYQSILIRKISICKNGLLCQVFVQSELNYKLFL